MTKHSDPALIGIAQAGTTQVNTPHHTGLPGGTKLLLETKMFIE